jgi:ceramide glucosyltransferase
MAGMLVNEYIARVRWQRVRKFITVAVTPVEPGAESLLCSAIGAFAFTKLPFF